MDKKIKYKSCSDCYYYNADNSIAELCSRTDESIYDSRPKGSRFCEHFTECIHGPLNWEDVKCIVEIADRLCPYTDKDIAEFRDNFQTEDSYYREVLRQYNESN